MLFDEEVLFVILNLLKKLCAHTSMDQTSTRDTKNPANFRRTWMLYMCVCACVC